MSSVTGPTTYGTETKAIYSSDGKTATFILKNVEYKDMPADFVDLLMLIAAQFNI